MEVLNLSIFADKTALFADEAHLAKDADGVLIKPTNRDELFAVMMKVLQKK